MKAIPLEATKREITGKKVKKLRKQGWLPVGVYGKDVKSKSLSVQLKDFYRVYEKAGETGLVDLKVDEKVTSVLIKNVQTHPVSRQFLHAELHAVKLTEKIKAKVPLEVSGESPAVVSGAGVLLSTISEVEVQALPAQLPENIDVNIDNLTEVEQQITVGELKVSEGVEILTSKDEIVVKIAPAVSEETAKELAAEAAEKAAEETTEGGEVTVPGTEEISENKSDQSNLEQKQ